MAMQPNGSPQKAFFTQCIYFSLREMLARPFENRGQPSCGETQMQIICYRYTSYTNTTAATPGTIQWYSRGKVCSWWELQQ